MNNVIKQSNELLGSLMKTTLGTLTLYIIAITLICFAIIVIYHLIIGVPAVLNSNRENKVYAFKDYTLVNFLNIIFLIILFILIPIVLKTLAVDSLLINLILNVWNSIFG
jgi:hypothetical protein